MAKRKPRELRIEYIPLAEIRRDPNNPKDHDLSALAESMARFGYVAPMVLNEETGELLAGHGRLDELEALRAGGADPPAGIRSEGGDWLAPVVRGIELDPTDGRAYVVADNRMVALGGWNEPLLIERLVRLAGDGGLDGVGYDGDDLDRLIRLTGYEMDWEEAFGRLPLDKPEFQQVSFILHDEQVEVVRAAVDAVKAHLTDMDLELNRNRNGAALALICAGFLEGQK